MNTIAGNTEPLLHVCDNLNGLIRMIDGGGTLSLVPATQDDRASRPTSTPLQAANSTIIASYGPRYMTIGLGDCKYEWDVTVMDVPSPIIGADFVMEYHLAGDYIMGLLLDLDNKTVAGNVFAAHSFCINFVNNAYTELLDECPELTTLAFSPDKVKHGVQHHIPTEGTPIYARACRLTLDELAAAKAEFDKLLKLGIVRRSKSS